MASSRVFRRLILAAGIAMAAAVQPALAQDVAESHLRAARAALASLGTTNMFDNVLPRAAQALKAELIQKNPDLQTLIIQTVDETAVALAARRADLEREAAMAYARSFDEQQLNEIATFYNSETGKKLISDGPIVIREIDRAAGIWQNGIARDLAQQVAIKLTEAAPQATPPDAATAPAEGEAAPSDSQ
jgi:hypothetical protein